MISQLTCSSAEEEEATADLQILSILLLRFSLHIFHAIIARRTAEENLWAAERNLSALFHRLDTFLLPGIFFTRRIYDQVPKGEEEKKIVRHFSLFDFAFQFFVPQGERDEEWARDDILVFDSSQAFQTVGIVRRGKMCF